MGIIEKISSLFKKDERRYGLFSMSFEQYKEGKLVFKENMSVYTIIPRTVYELEDMKKHYKKAYAKDKNFDVSEIYLSDITLINDVDAIPDFYRESIYEND